MMEPHNPIPYLKHKLQELLAERDHLRNVRKTQEEEMQQRQAEILAIKTEMYSNFVPETNISEMMETVNEVRKMCHYFHEKIAEGKSNDANGKLQLEKIRQEYRDQLEMFSGVVDEFSPEELQLKKEEQEKEMSTLSETMEAAKKSITETRKKYEGLEMLAGKNRHEREEVLNTARQKLAVKQEMLFQKKAKLNAINKSVADKEFLKYLLAKEAQQRARTLVSLLEKSGNHQRIENIRNEYGLISDKTHGI